MENKHKHLEFIQNIITRMSTSSFQIKSWVITLIAGLFAISIPINNLDLLWIAFPVIIMFWALNSFFLNIERKYRNLYKEVAKIKDDNEVNFNLDIKYHKKKNFVWFKRELWFWLKSAFNITHLLFYGTILITTFIAIILLNKNKEISNYKAKTELRDTSKRIYTNDTLKK